MSEEHFDGILQDDDRSPDGYKKVSGVGAVLVDPNTGRLVLTGRPNDVHNCDRRGCGSVDHKIAEFDVDAEQFEPIRNHTQASD
jgi:hypothetical protein